MAEAGDQGDVVWASKLPDAVSEKLAALPASPGVYLFKDKKGDVLYVGKAKSLRSRVRSYFQPGGSDARMFIPVLQRTIGDLETIVTLTEKEAAILENNLIKEHRPRYNVKLRDDKDYISLRLDPKTDWARLHVVRRPSADGAKYFGPYHSATAARRTLHLVNKHFQLRTCTDTELRNRRRPCLQHQIKRCPAPCVLEVDRAWYDEQVRAVAMFLDGRHDELSSELQLKMRGAATDLRFELAAVYRDQLGAIDKIRETQRVVAVDDVDRDVLGLHREGDLVELALLFVRKGKLADVLTYSIKSAEVPDDEVVAAFLAQRYGSGEGEDDGAPIPDEVLVPVQPDAALGVAEWLTDRAGHKVAILTPQRGHKMDLLRMATENAAHAFQEKRRATDDVTERLEQMKQRLRLPTTPRRIECCDISHLGGGDTVGAVIAFADGEPDRAHYRTYHLRGDTGAPGPAPPMRGDDADDDDAPGLSGDDYRAMYEVLARRFRRGLVARASKEAQEDGEPVEEDTWNLPDLFVVDGGRGQLAVALAAARDLGLHDLPIVALAKEKENVLGETLVDRVYLPGQKNPIPLRSHSASLYFLARARDEAHRFANRAREKLGKKRRIRSALEDVAGIGEKTRKALLMHLGSVKAVAAAEDAALLAVPGVTARHVKALRRVFPAPPAAPREDV